MMQCPKCKQKVDEDLLPLITELNKVGLYTKYCCSGHDGEYAYIMLEGDIIKHIEYGIVGEKWQSSGVKFTLRWKIPKYPRKHEIICSDCDKPMKEVKEKKDAKKTK
jgi:hypothetical protein